MIPFTITGTPSGTDGTDGLAVFTLSPQPGYLELFNNGARMYPTIGYTLSASTVTFLSPYIPVTGDLLLAMGEQIASSPTGGATTLADLLKPALRIAGVTTRPGIIPSVDQYGELIPATNRMLASWNCDGHKIFNSSIDEYTLTASQKIYTIGPGGNLNNPRPLYITQANIIFPTTPQVRRPVAILDDEQWSHKAVQDITGAPSWELYYDGGLDSNGRARIYIYPQPPAGYKLELYTWQALLATFSATTDGVLLPPGYEQAIVDNLALVAARLYRTAISPDMRDAARRSLDTLMTLNAFSPKLRTDPALGSRGGRGDRGYGWLDGSIR